MIQRYNYVMTNHCGDNTSSRMLLLTSTRHCLISFSLFFYGILHTYMICEDIICN